MYKTNCSVTEDTLFALMSLVNSKCPYPGCNKDARITVSCVKKSKDSPQFENSLVFCEEHALQCQHNKVSEKMFWDIRHLLKPNRFQDNIKKNRTLYTRNEYLNKIIDELDYTSTLRCIYVGPLAFHPDWYFNMYEGHYKIASMDRAINRILCNPKISVSLILRNTERYFNKVQELIPKSLYSVLIDETCYNFEKLMQPEYNNKCIFLDTGHFHIPIIYDNACVFAARAQDNTPINGGLVTYDEDQIQWERDAFDRLLQSHVGNVANKNELYNFLLKGLN